MTRFLLTMLLFHCVLSGRAQHAPPSKFSVNLAAGLALPNMHSSNYDPRVSENDVTTGVVFSLEPKTLVLPALAVGLRLEGLVLPEKGGVGFGVKGGGSAVLTTDYFITGNAANVFVGAGVGMFKTHSQAGKLLFGSQAGAMCRAGFEVKHFRAEFAYNFINTGSNYYPYTYNYGSLKLGVLFGRGASKG